MSCPSALCCRSTGDKQKILPELIATRYRSQLLVGNQLRRLFIFIWTGSIGNEGIGTKLEPTNIYCWQTKSCWQYENSSIFCSPRNQKQKTDVNSIWRVHFLKKQSIHRKIIIFCFKLLKEFLIFLPSFKLILEEMKKKLIWFFCFKRRIFMKLSEHCWTLSLYF